MNTNKFHKFLPFCVAVIFISSCVGVNNTVKIKCDSGLAKVTMEIGISFHGADTHTEIYPGIDSHVKELTQSFAEQGGGTWSWRQHPEDSGTDMQWAITGINVPIENLALLGLQTEVTIDDTDDGRIINIRAAADPNLFIEVDQWNTTSQDTELSQSLAISGGKILSSNAEMIFR